VLHGYLGASGSGKTYFFNYLKQLQLPAINDDGIGKILGLDKIFLLDASNIEKSISDLFSAKSTLLL
jgi:dephospho-CoA kinase